MIDRAASRAALGVATRALAYSGTRMPTVTDQ